MMSVKKLTGRLWRKDRPENALTIFGSILSLLLALFPFLNRPGSITNPPVQSPKPTTKVTREIRKESILDDIKAEICLCLPKDSDTNSSDNTPRMSQTDIAPTQQIKQINNVLYKVKSVTIPSVPIETKLQLMKLVGNINQLITETEKNLPSLSPSDARKKMEELVGAIKDTIEAVDEKKRKSITHHKPTAKKSPPDFN